MAAHVLFIPPRDSLCVCLFVQYNMCVILPACLCVYTVRVLEPRVFMCSNISDSATSPWATFKWQRSFGCLRCRRASKPHFALCVPLQKATLEYQRRIQQQYSLTTFFKQYLIVFVAWVRDTWWLTLSVSLPRCFSTTESTFSPARWLTYDLCNILLMHWQL